MIFSFISYFVKHMTDFSRVVKVVGSPKLNVKGLLPNEQVYKGVLDCFSKTYKEAGVRGLYRGVGKLQ